MCTPSPSHFSLDQAREYNILIIMIINIIYAPRPHPTLAWSLENTNNNDNNIDNFVVVVAFLS